MTDDSWLTADVITKARMNKKTVFVDTGANISALATTYGGMLAYCTASGSGFTIDTLYERNTANSAWSAVGVDQKPYLALSTTIGDYTSPASATASSESGIPTFQDLFTSSAGWTTTQSADWSVDTPNTEIDFSVDGSGVDRIYHDLGAGNVSDTAWVLRIHQLNFSTQNTYTNVVMAISSTTTQRTASQDGIGCWMMDGGDASDYFHAASGDGAALANSGNSMSGLWATGTDYYIEIIRASATSLTGSIKTGSFSGTTVASFSITIPNTITGLRYIKFMEGDTGVPSAKQAVGTIQKVQFWNGVTSAPTSNAASNVYDTDTSTRWQSNSEANPAIYVDLSGSAREIVGVAINLDRTTTTVTSLKIRASTDTSFDDSENVAYVNVSDFTDDTWRFLANNFLATNCRYVQVYANETGVLSINEIKVRYGASDAAKILGHKHRTRSVSAADSFVDSN